MADDELNDQTFGGRPTPHPSRPLQKRATPILSLVNNQNHVLPTTAPLSGDDLGGGGGLPDFFGSHAGAAGGMGGDDDDLNGLTFGDGFDIPLTGLPEFFSMLGEGPGHAMAAAEEDDLAAITGAATSSDWSSNAAKFADIQAQYLRDWQHKRVRVRACASPPSSA